VATKQFLALCLNVRTHGATASAAATLTVAAGAQHWASIAKFYCILKSNTINRPMFSYICGFVRR
jgi:hypothetical protein